MSEHQDQDLLALLIALHLNLVDSDLSLAEWNQPKAAGASAARPSLEELGTLSEPQKQMLEAIAASLLESQGGDPERRLNALSQSLGLAELPTANEKAARDPADRDPAEAEKDAEISATAEDVKPRPRAKPGAKPLEVLGHRFLIEGPYRGGGQGMLHCARDLELGRSVLLKRSWTVNADRQDVRDRLVLEAEINGKLEHPQIVPIYGFGRDARGRPFFAMRRVEGQDFQDAIAAYHQAAGPDRFRRIGEFRELLERFVDVCNAIAYAHSRGVIHRDIKPRNIRLGRRFGETFILDWGLAKLLKSDGAIEDPASDLGLDTDIDIDIDIDTDGPLKPSSGSDVTADENLVVGTFSYMSPEQARVIEAKIGSATDVYSLGATLWTVLTGKSPFNDVPRERIPACLKDARIPTARSVRPDAPRPLEAICRKAMSHRPEDRYSSPLALAEDVKNWLAGEPVSVDVEPRIERLARWERRHRAWLRAGGAALALITLVSLAFAAVITRAWNVTDDALERSIASEQIAREEREAAEEARAVAERRFRNMRLIFDQYITPIIDRIHFIPGAETDRLALAEVATNRYSAFLEATPEDSELRDQAARVFRISANVRRLLGRDDAGALYDEALALIDARRDPNAAALVLSDRAGWHRIHGRYEDAEADIQRGLDTLEAANGSVDDEQRAERMLAESLLRLARSRCRLETGLFAQAEPESRRAYDHLDTLAERFSVKRKHIVLIQLLLVYAAQDQSAALSHFDDRRHDAKAWSEQALTRAQALVRADQRSDPNLITALARAELERAAVIMLDEDPARRAEAIRLVTDARSRAIRHFNRYNEILPNALLAFEAMNDRAELLKAAGQAAKAEDEATLVLNTLSEPRKVLREHPALYSARGRALAVLTGIAQERGQAEQADAHRKAAIAAFEQALERRPDHWADRQALERLRAAEPPAEPR